MVCASLMHWNQNSPSSGLFYAWSWPSKLASDGVLTLWNLVLCFSLKKWEGFPPRQTQVLLSLAVTSVAVPCCQLSFIPCVFRHCDPLVLKIIMLNQCHEKKLKTRKDSFTNIAVNALSWKLNCYSCFFMIKTVCNRFCYWNNLFFCLNSRYRSEGRRFRSFQFSLV